MIAHKTASLKSILFAVVGAAAVLSGPLASQAPAQQVPGRMTAAAPVQPVAPASPAPQAKAEWILTPDQDMVRVPLNKVVSVRLPGPARNVVVANPDIADVILPQDGERNHVFVLARQIGSTTIVFEDGRGNILFQGDIQVDVDVAGIQAAIKDVMPEEKIIVAAHRNSVFLKGFVRSAVASNAALNIARKFVQDPIQVVNNLEILGSQQVIMQVRVAEIKRTALKNLGINLTLNASGALNGFTMTTSPVTTISSFGSTVANTSWGGLGSLTIRALESQNLAKTLAEPTLTALSGETASFLVGGSFPMPVSHDATNNTTAYVQQPFGVSLNFTPVVMDKGLISLRIKSEVSDRDTTVAVTIGGASIPGLTTKTTETTVELPSGGTLYIAGLLQSDLTNFVEGLPGLKDLPILGTLFRSQSFRNRETEMVVSLTAYLAAPTSNSTPLAMPTDGFQPSGDLDFYLLGRLHKLYAQKELPPYATPLTGPYGYIME